MNRLLREPTYDNNSPRFYAIYIHINIHLNIPTFYIYKYSYNRSIRLMLARNRDCVKTRDACIQ